MCGYKLYMRTYAQQPPPQRGRAYPGAAQTPPPARGRSPARARAHCCAAQAPLERVQAVTSSTFLTTDAG